MRQILQKLWLVCLFFTANCVFAATQEGTNYTVLPESLAESALVNQDKNVIEVVEFFSYGCPACYSVSDDLSKWESTMPSKVVFRRIPVVFHAGWEPVAKAFYTAEILGVLDKLDGDLFSAIHKERKNLNTKDKIREIFVKNGIDSQKFDSTYDSFAVSRELIEGKTLMRHFKIISIPTVIVNNRYLTSLEMAHSGENLVEVINHLIKQ